MPTNSEILMRKYACGYYNNFNTLDSCRQHLQQSPSTFADRNLPASIKNIQAMLSSSQPSDDDAELLMAEVATDLAQSFLEKSEISIICPDEDFPKGVTNMTVLGIASFLIQKSVR